MQHYCGCYWILPGPLQWSPPIRHYLPQANVKAHTTIFASASRTQLTQTFVNPSSTKAIREIRYTFPLYDGVSVVGFVCRVADRVITGEVQEKDKARKTYQAAVEKGETAGLLEQLPAASDVFTTTIGNVPPGATIYVDITYVGELKHDAEVDGVRFTIPTNIAPRYGNLPGEVRKADTAIPEKGGFEVIVDAELPNGAFIREMRSPSHPVAVSLGTTSVTPDADPAMNRASATLSLGSAELDKDFILQVVAKETGNPKAILETHPTIPGQRALLATLVPKFALKPERPEIVFICDRSGSMGGSKIKKLVEALKVFLKSLPTGVKFNICSFGSSYSFLWDKSKTYSQASLDEAVRHVETFSANFGGTEMLLPVKGTLKHRYKDMSLEVFLVTDGEIWNQEELFQYINEEIQVKKAPVRIFTLGIGSDVSHALIEGVAKAGNGFSQAVGNDEKLDSKVIRMLKAGLSPHINGYSLEVRYHDADDDFEVVEKVADSLQVNLKLSDTTDKAKAPEKKIISLFDTTANPDAPVTDSDGDKFNHVPKVPVPKMLQAPNQIPPLYAFSRTAVYLLMSPDSTQRTPSSVILRATSSQGPLELEIPVAILPQAGTTIHQLAAHKAIQELEEGRGWLVSATENGKKLKDKYEGRFQDMVEREAVRLGVTFQVQSKWTSFVAVEKKEKDKEGDEKMTDEGDFEFLDDAVPPSYEQDSESSFVQSGPGSKSHRHGRSVRSGGSTMHPIGGVAVASTAAGAAPSVDRLQSVLTRGERLDTLSARSDQLSGSSAMFSAQARSRSAKKSASPFRGLGSAASGMLGSRTAAYGSAAPAAARPAFADTRSTAPAPAAPVVFGSASVASEGNFATAEVLSTALSRRCGVGEDSEDDEDADVLAETEESTPRPKKPWRYNPEATFEKKMTEGYAAKAPRTGGLLQDLIALQTFEGFWSWSPKLFEICSLTEAECEKPLGQVDGLKGADGKNVFATALAVRFLETKLKGEKETWELIVDKARERMEEKAGGLEMVGKVCAAVDGVLRA